MRFREQDNVVRDEIRFKFFGVNRCSEVHYVREGDDATQLDAGSV